MTNEKMENLQKMNTVMGFGIAYMNGGGYDEDDNEEFSWNDNDAAEAKGVESVAAGGVKEKPGPREG